MLAIRPATSADNAAIDYLYQQAREFMAANGNPTQWVGNFPNSSILQDDMKAGNVFVCCDLQENGESPVVGVYALATTEPVYNNLKGGKWQKNDPFVVIHRMATKQGKGVGSFIFREIQKQYPYIRIDTHEDNVPMRSLLQKLGFVYCGLVFYSRPNGGERVAYDYVRP